jgi:hypothetical protein
MSTQDTPYAYENAAEGHEFSSAEALYDALTTTGYVQSKRDFAEMLDIGLGNVYNYLPAPNGSRRTKPLLPTLETVHRWCSTVRAATGLEIDIICPAGGQVELEVRGTNRAGQQLSAIRYRTNCGPTTPASPPEPASP